MLEISSVWSLIQSKLRCPIALVDSMAGSLFEKKGKAIRSQLICNLAKSYASVPTASQQRDLLTCCAIIEMIHTGTLVHDDVIDTSATRRGKLANHEIFGNTCSVLMGDYLFTKAFSLAFELSSSAEFLERLAIVTGRLVEGELLQIQYKNSKSCDMKTYQTIISYKTAALFELAAQVIGLFVSPEQFNELSKYGDQLGHLFQIIDDYLDYFAGQQNLGKPVGGDFKERKKTYPLLIAAQRYPEILDMFDNPKGEFETFMEVFSPFQGEIFSQIELQAQRFKQELVHSKIGLSQQQVFAQMIDGLLAKASLQTTLKAVVE